MPLLKASQIREMTKDERAIKLRELQNELFVERGKAGSMGGGNSAGRVKSLKTEVARVKTVMHEKNEA
jgi:ribosomal protein L29